MYKRLLPGDHPRVAACLYNTARHYHARGRMATAQPLQRDALRMVDRLAAAARDGSEGDALTFANSHPSYRSAFLSTAHTNRSDALARTIQKLDAVLHPLLPARDRLGALDGATPDDLRNALPTPR